MYAGNIPVKEGGKKNNMDRRTEEILQMAEKARIGVDDTFRFRCTACGKCCTNREDIMMNPLDVYRAAKHLEMEVTELLDKYCIVFVGRSSLLPIVSPKMKGRIKKCPFLENRKCSIHEAKPAVCELFPLGRIGDGKADGKVSYFLQPLDCGKKDEVHTVREWLSGSGLKESEEWFFEWQAAIAVLSKKMRSIFLDPGEDVLKDKDKAEKILLIGGEVEKALIATIYLNYDMDKEFLPQFKENLNEATNMLDMTESFIKTACKA